MTEQWHERFTRMRKARGWSLTQAAHELISASDAYTPHQIENARRTIVRWERGEVARPRTDTRKAIAKMFDVPVADFWHARPLSAEPAPTRPAPEEWADILDQLRTGDTSGIALERSAIEVERVCTDYAAKPAPEVLSDVHELGRALFDLKPSTDLKGHREIYRQLGWLSMLRACLLYDLGSEKDAHIARRMGIQLADDLGDRRISAWGDEIAAWIALTRGDLAQAIRAAQVGIDKAPTTDVAAQLYAQQAKAYSRLKDRHKTELCLEKVRQVLDSVEMPDNLRNHFAIDPTKATFYAMDAYRVVGNDDYANAMADSVIATSTTPDDEVISPMRLAEGQLTKAVIAARIGEIGTATTLAEEALAIERQSGPSLLMVAREVAREVSKFDQDEGRDFAHALKGLTPA